MASGGKMNSVAGRPKPDAMLVDKLPEEINEMKIKDDKQEKVDLEGMNVNCCLVVATSVHFGN